MSEKQQTPSDEPEVEECKFCLSCTTAKPLVEFYRDHKSRMSGGRWVRKIRLQADHCSTCMNEVIVPCPGCQEAMPLNAFYYSFFDDYERSRYCRDCWRKAYRASKVYKVSVDRYLKILEKQDGRCALCSRGPAADLVPDHCHATEKFRGLLCKTCNAGLGLFYDKPALLRAAALYLERHAK